MKILLIEDDADIIETFSLCFSVSMPEAQVLVAKNGQSGLDMLKKENPDVVILDLGLPDMDGLDICREIRHTSQIPIIILTARQQEMDKVKGLELGADDYMTKPYSYIELIARIRAVLRRSQAALPVANEPPYVTGKLSIDFNNREVRYDGNLVKLTPIEYNLLYHLVKNKGTVIAYRTLLAKVWGREYAEETDYLKVHIQHLRQKLSEFLSDQQIIANERGLGYKFVEPPEN